MKVKFRYLVCVLLWISQTQMLAQSPIEITKEQRKDDSLIMELKRARHDTDRIKLRFLLGQRGPGIRIYRRGYWDSIISDANKLNFKLYEVKALNVLGIMLSQQIQDSAAIGIFNKALEISEEHRFYDDMANSLYFITFCYARQNVLKKSVEYCLKGLKLSEKIGSKVAALRFSNKLGTIYFQLRDFNKSLKLHLQCLKLAQELKFSADIVDALTSVGSDYEWLNKKDKAADYYLQCIKYVEEFDENLFKAEVYNAIGSGYLLKGLPDSSYFYYIKSYNLCRKGNSPSHMASVMTSLSAYYLSKGDLTNAKKQAMSAFELAKNAKFIMQIQSITELLKKIYTKEGNYKSALEAYELNIKTRDSLSNEKVRKEATDREYTYNLEKKEDENKLLAQQNQIQNLEMKQSRYFSFGLGLLLLLVILVAVLFARQNRFRNEQKNVQIEQKLLRTQMNPHFIFNALNTIQQFIITLDNEKAQLYLSKFSRLMRKLLESNVKDSITLKEEVEILEKYLEIESLRFNNVFTYQIKVNDDMNPEHINIPHFLIQPFVENAIWHGLLPKEGDKELHILFERQDEKTLRCTIDDNGIGRQNKLREAPFEEKKSLAISFIKQRLDLMNRVKKTNYALTLTDKTDAQGKSAGLRVIITMPVLSNKA